MVLKVLPATERDAPRAVAIENIAYGPNPVGDALYPGPFPANPDGSSPRSAHLADLLRADPACRWAKVVDTDIEGEQHDQQVVAFSMWYFWPEPQPPQEPQVWGPGTNPEACEMFFGEFRKRRNERFAGKPFAFLKLLHTDPAHQRRGAASMLLKWGAEEADRLGLETYLESSPQGKSLYEKCGFREVDRFVADFSKWGGPKEHVSALMVRPASK